MNYNIFLSRDNSNRILLKRKKLIRTVSATDSGLSMGLRSRWTSRTGGRTLYSKLSSRTNCTRRTQGIRYGRGGSSNRTLKTIRV